MAWINGAHWTLAISLVTIPLRNPFLRAPGLVNSSSSPSTETDSQACEDTSSSGSIEQRVSVCAAETSSRAEFLQRLAAEISKTFDVDIVAVESTDWSGPMMLVTSDDLARRISRDSIRELLASAAIVPIACDVQLEIPTDAGAQRTRALRVELTDAPYRSAILLVYPADVQPTPTDQLNALKKLGEYSKSARSKIGGLSPIDSDRALTRDQSSSDATAAALRARHALSQFHADLDLDATSYRIANESRRLLNCDRTTVLTQRGGRLRVSAISGVAVVDSRSNSVKSAEELARRVSVMSRTMVLPSDEPLPPQIQEPLDRYLDETGVSTTIVLPLHKPDDCDQREEADSSVAATLEGDGDIIAMMMLEYFAGEPPQAIGPATALVASEAMYALRNSMEHRNVFGLSLWKSVGSVLHSGKMPLIALGGAAMIGLLLLSIFIQVEHHVIATGSVQPTMQRQVFASVDGVVKQIDVTDGQVVKSGDSLLRMENADLESRAESLTGELQTSSKRLASILAMRLNANTDATQADRLGLEERQLRSEVQNLESQLELVKLQQEDLIVRSPIDGTVVGWQLDRRLSDRPISRGNLLLRVVDHTGKWSLRLNVPDRNAGPILEALETQKELPVQFAVATDPNGSYSASLKQIATAARLDESGLHVIDATAEIRGAPTSAEEVSQSESVGSVAPATPSSLSGTTNLEFDADQPSRSRFNAADVRVGADVTARISCGKRSVLRSWFSDAFDFVDRNVLFYFR